jgi:hypothetical protein
MFTVCHLLGDYLEAIDKNYEKAWKVYKDNCDTGNFARSCVKCGDYLAFGKGGQKQDKVKVSIFNTGRCEMI